VRQPWLQHRNPSFTLRRRCARVVVQRSHDVTPHRQQLAVEQTLGQKAAAAHQARSAAHATLQPTIGLIHELRDADGSSPEKTTGEVPREIKDMLLIAHNPPPLLLQRRQRFAVVRQPFFLCGCICAECDGVLAGEPAVEGEGGCGRRACMRCG
jgi:hypothetical protein